MELLRSPDGCPWDREQTHESLLPYLIEETYELVDAVKDSNDEALKEELGDLLLQVIFHSQIAKERGAFSIEEVIDSVAQKLVERHPHVFGKERAESPRDVNEIWEKVKKKEKKDRESLLDSVPSSMPALDRAYKLQKKAESVGFDWNSFEEIIQKVKEELSEIEEALKSGKREKVEEEVGDFLFMAVNLARFLGVHPEVALRRANKKFEERFRHIERRAREMGRELKEMELEEMEKLWQEAKRKE